LKFSPKSADKYKETENITQSDFQEEQEMAILERITGVRKFPAHVIGNGEIQIKVKRELLNPLGRETSGILKIGNQTIYPPKYGKLTIGGNRKCDIRVKGEKNLKLFDTALTFAGEGEFRIFKMPISRVAVRKTGGEIEEIKDGNEPVEGRHLSDIEAIYLPLMGRGAHGTGRYIEIKVEMDKPANLAEDIKSALVFESKPPIETGSPQSKTLVSSVEEPVGSLAPQGPGGAEEPGRGRRMAVYYSLRGDEINPLLE
jgi:hypothetical protein